MARETLLVADLRPRNGSDDEAEPVLVIDQDQHVLLVLDDGTRLEFDRSELLAALEAEQAA